LPHPRNRLSLNPPSDPAPLLRYILILGLLFLFIPPFLFAQTDDKLICNKVFSFAFEHRLSQKKPGDIIITIGKRFLGSPYEEHTLDTGFVESLTANLHSFDCVTYVENILALAQCVMNNHLSFDQYCAALETIRYRGGMRRGYASRLHYFSEWIRDNEQKGFVRDITRNLHGTPEKKELNYLSTHPALNRFPETDSAMARIESIEKELSLLNMYRVSVADFVRIEPKIGDGDIIAVTTTEEGLDVGHTGFAIHGADGFLHLLHASESRKKVEVTSERLRQYLRNHRKDSGVMVIRVLPTPPR